METLLILGTAALPLPHCESFEFGGTFIHWFAKPAAGSGVYLSCLQAKVEPRPGQDAELSTPHKSLQASNPPPSGWEDTVLTAALWHLIASYIHLRPTLNKNNAALCSQYWPVNKSTSSQCVFLRVTRTVSGGIARHFWSFSAATFQTGEKVWRQDQYFTGRTKEKHLFFVSQRLPSSSLKKETIA